jgi:hypothetical protein
MINALQNIDTKQKNKYIEKYNKKSHVFPHGFNFITTLKNAYLAPQERSMAGAEGFEPPITGPKPVALPLGHAPKKLSTFIFYYSSSDTGCAPP